jgi:hypothetical protein
LDIVGSTVTKVPAFVVYASARAFLFSPWFGEHIAFKTVVVENRASAHLQKAGSRVRVWGEFSPAFTRSMVTEAGERRGRAGQIRIPIYSARAFPSID